MLLFRDLLEQRLDFLRHALPLLIGGDGTVKQDLAGGGLDGLEMVFVIQRNGVMPIIKCD